MSSIIGKWEDGNTFWEFVAGGKFKHGLPQGGIEGTYIVEETIDGPNVMQILLLKPENSPEDGMNLAVALSEGGNNLAVTFNPDSEPQIFTKLTSDKIENPHEKADESNESSADDLLAQANSGNKDAMYSLSLSYLEVTNITQKDIDLSLEWLNKAADAGHNDAMHTVVRFMFEGKVDMDIDRACKLAYELDKQNSSQDRRDLFYDYAKKTFTIDSKRAVHIWSKLAEFEHLPSQSWLSKICMYGSDYGIQRNAETAFRWAIKAVSHPLASNSEYNDDIATAQSMLGIFYSDGIGGAEKDVDKALQYAKEARARGNESARKLVGLLEEKSGKSQSSSSGGGGCYIATCVYGSYDCPEVWTLRQYRDNTLSQYTLGRLFIRAYYGVSPTIVTIFGKAKWFQSIAKPVLDKIVSMLS